MRLFGALLRSAWLAASFVASSDLSFAQSVSETPRVYVALAGNAGGPETVLLAKALLETIRRNIRYPAMVSDVAIIPTFSADDADHLLPPGFNRYLVASLEPSYEGGLGNVVSIMFEVGRLVLDAGSRKLDFASIMSGSVSDNVPESIIIVPPGQRPAELMMLLNGEWVQRPNSTVAGNVSGWVTTMLPELRRKYTFAVVCIGATKTWTVEDILSARSSLVDSTRNFLQALTSALEDPVLGSPSWESIQHEFTGCGIQANQLHPAAHYVLRGSFTDEQMFTGDTEHRFTQRRFHAMALHLRVEDQTRSTGYKLFSPPLNAPHWEEEQFPMLSLTMRPQFRELEDLCADNVAVLVRDRFPGIVAKYVRAVVYGPRYDIEPIDRCHKSQ